MGPTVNDSPCEETADLEKQLAQANQRYYALFEKTNDAVFLIDLEGFHFKVNHRAAEMLGYTVDELLNLSYREIVHTGELMDAKSRLSALIEGEVFPIYERTFRKKDGTLLPVEINVFLVRDKDGTPLHFQSIVRDISVRKILEESIKKSEERYRLMAEHVKDVIITMDLELNFTYASHAVEQVTGYSIEEILSLNVSEVLLPESLQLVRDAMNQAFELERNVGPEGYEAPPIDIGLYHKNGTLIWAEVSRVVLRDEDGVPVGVLGVLRDITRRKRAEEALQQSERRHRELIEKNPEGIGIVDFDERFIFSNQALADLLGYEIDELVGMSLSDFVSERDYERIRQQTSIRLKGESSTYQHEMKRKDGSVIFVRVSAVPWRDDDGNLTGSIAVVSDITEGVKARSALEITNRDLELYTSLLRHDLRNDLQIILNQAEAAEMLGSEGADSAELCATAKYVANRMLQLLEVIKAPEGELSGNLLEILELKVRIAEKTYEQMKVHLSYNDPREQYEIRRGRLIGALFDNLFRNSSQHAGSNVQVDITLQRIDDVVQVDFIDNGPGIDHSIEVRLFQRGTTNGGRGQGLYLCKQIAKAYNGDIQLLPTKSGTGFRVTLPVA